MAYLLTHQVCNLVLHSAVVYMYTCTCVCHFGCGVFAGATRHGEMMCVQCTYTVHVLCRVLLVDYMYAALRMYSKAVHGNCTGTHASSLNTPAFHLYTCMCYLQLLSECVL